MMKLRIHIMEEFPLTSTYLVFGKRKCSNKMKKIAARLFLI